jgi:protein dithiol oxidoreductase (disulfide-forming)
VNRRDFSTHLIGVGIATTGACVALPASAQADAPREGAQFTRVEPPVLPAANGKIEVLEFFSYACPHCNAFEPAVDAWAKKLPADVSFKRVPVHFLMNAENFARTYYALETMGQVDALNRKIFAAVHVDRLRLDKPEDIAALVAKNGVDGAKFLSAFNSFSVATSVTRAKKLAESYRLDGVPTMAVQGRYVTSPGQAGNGERALAVVDFLVARARKA